MVSGIAVVIKSVQAEPRLHAMVMVSVTKPLEVVRANLDGVGIRTALLAPQGGLVVTVQ